MHRLSRANIGRLIALLIVVLGIMGPVGHVHGASAATSPALITVATTGLVGDLVRRIGGDLVEVRWLMPPNTDPGAFRPPEDAAAILDNADILFMNGLGLERHLDSFVARAGESADVVAVADAVPNERLIAEAGDTSSYDPHIWFDPALWSIAAGKVASTLSEHDADHAEFYHERLATTERDFAALADYVASQIGRVPSPDRRVAMPMDTMSYLASQYELTVVAPDTDAGAIWPHTAALGSWASRAQEMGIRTFAVSATTPRVVEDAAYSALVDQGIDVLVVRNLYLETIGDLGSLEGSYIGMIRYDVDLLVRTLLTASVDPGGVTSDPSTPVAR